MHPAYDGLASLPFYDEFDLSQVDVLLISQYVSTLIPLYHFGNGSAMRSPMSMRSEIATYFLKPITGIPTFSLYTLYATRVHIIYPDTDCCVEQSCTRESMKDPFHHLCAVFLAHVPSCIQPQQISYAIVPLICRRLRRFC